MASWLSGFFSAEFEGKNLQRSGRLTRDQVLQFFEHGSALFSNVEFKKALSRGYQSGQNVQELIDQAQAKVWEDKVEPAVQGDFGIKSLQNVLSQFGKDAEFTTLFYKFVHLEERTLDEAEMQQEDFAAKYQHLNRMQEALESKMQENEDKMKGMSEQEKQQFMAQMYKTIVDASLSMSGDRDTCCPPSASACMQAPGPMDPTQAPRVEELPSRCDWKSHETCTHK